MARMWAIKSKSFGEVSEWLKEHAWKVCVRQRTEGSNPSLTAINKKPGRAPGFLFIGLGWQEPSLGSTKSAAFGYERHRREARRGKTGPSLF